MASLDSRLPEHWKSLEATFTVPIINPGDIVTLNCRAFDAQAQKPKKLTRLEQQLLDDPHYVASAGRRSYYVDFKSPADEYVRGAEPKKVNEGANVWSSESRILPGYHLPCFDVDMPPTVVLTNLGTLQLAGPRQVGDIVQDTLQEAYGHPVDAKWKASTTEGHYHVYVEHPIEWVPYSELLRKLSLYQIVEEGYWRASMKRKGSYVRLPGVKKEASEAAPAPEEQLDWNDDMEPF